MRTAILAVLLIVATAGSCPVDSDPKPGTPPILVAGNWVGELFGVRFLLSMAERGRVDDDFQNSTVTVFVLRGSGWLVYGSTPAESVAVALEGFNIGGPGPLISFEIQEGPNGAGGVYGDYSGVLQEDGSLLGPFTRMPGIEPSPSPWTATWPEGTTSGALRLTRQ